MSYLSNPEDYTVQIICSASDSKVKADPRYPWKNAPMGTEKIMVKDGNYVAIIPKPKES